MESLSDIEEELRALSKSDEYSVQAKYAEHQPTVRGKPILLYFAEIADRIEAAAKRDERLMLSLMLYAVEDYVEDWAGPNYKSCVQSACKRLGIEYHSSARQLWEQIEEKIKRMEGSANEKPE